MVGVASRRAVNLLPTHPDHPERTRAVHELTQLAFAPYAALARPSGALAETVEAVATDLAEGGGLLAYDDTWTTALGALRWRLGDDHLWVKRVAVHPDHQGRGVGGFLMDAARAVALAHDRHHIRLGVRHVLTDNRAWYERRGYRADVDHDDWTELTAPVEPFTFRGRRATLHKLDGHGAPFARFDVDVVDEGEGGVWVELPPFTPHFAADGTITAITPATVIGFLPADEWWTAWWTAGHQRLKVDVCTSTVRRADGDLEFRDLALDVVVRGDGPPEVVDEDELAEAGYPPELETAARQTAADVLRRVRESDPPFDRT